MWTAGLLDKKNVSESIWGDILPIKTQVFEEPTGLALVPTALPPEGPGIVAKVVSGTWQSSLGKVQKMNE